MIIAKCQLNISFIMIFFLVCANKAQALHSNENDDPKKIAFQSKGTLSFKHNDKIFTADSDHARGYAAASSKTGYVSGSNKENMVLDIEVAGMYKEGIVTVNMAGKDKCTVTVNHISYYIKEATDFFKITVTIVKQEGLMTLLSGRFEGRLHDKNGNEAVITEGKFATNSL